jgi:hypothetical protein
MTEDRDTRPTEVWAVEYTTVCGERSVAIMESHELAVGWMKDLVRNSVAEPVLLCSTADFHPM